MNEEAKTPATLSPQSVSLPERRATLDMRCVTSAELLKGATEVAIEHNGELYVLRRTGRGRLILTK